MTLNVESELKLVGLLEFFVLKSKGSTYYDVSRIFRDKPLPFSRLNPKINYSTMTQLKACAELLNFTDFLKLYNRLELDVTNIYDDSRVGKKKHTHTHTHTQRFFVFFRSVLVSGMLDTFWLMKQKCLWGWMRDILNLP